jgi:hypothetical protein
MLRRVSVARRSPASPYSLAATGKGVRNHRQPLRRKRILTVPTRFFFSVGPCRRSSYSLTFCLATEPIDSGAFLPTAWNTSPV